MTTAGSPGERDDARFLDALNPRIKRLSRLQRKERLDICRSCDQYMRMEKCAVCGCIMPIKVGLPHASCPLGKWSKVNTDEL